MRTLRWLHRHLPEPVWDNLATVSILGLLMVLAFFAYELRQQGIEAKHNAQKAAVLSLENTRRINEIQDARRQSCQKTYFAIPDLLAAAFLPRDPKKWTPQQRASLRKLTRAATRKAEHCPLQTRTERR